MKTFKFYNLFSLLIIVAILASCVKSDDFDTPQTTTGEEPVLDGTIVPLESLAGAYEQALENVTFENTNTFVEGYVISSDEAGNFFEEIIIQDKLENPTIGVKILIDVNPLFTKYELGRKIFIKLDGLTTGVSNGVLALGIGGGEFLEKIPAALENEYFFRSTEVGVLVPKQITLEDLPVINNDEDGFRETNLYVSVSDVQFSKDEVISNSYTYASESFDQFDGERTLESCASDASIIFSTSTFADFKSLLLPAGRGTITGILTKNFFGDTFNFTVNEPTQVNLFDVNRCDPLEGFFFEDFEAFTTIGQLEAAGWTNQNVSGGNVEWFMDDFDNNSYPAVSAFGSGETDIQAWLVTPEINMDNTTAEIFTLDIQTNFNNAEVLTIWYSTNFTGDAISATWTQLFVDIPSGSASGFGSFESVGDVDVSFISGTVHFGFLYEGSDPNASTRYHIDNVEVRGN